MHNKLNIINTHDINDIDNKLISETTFLKEAIREIETLNIYAGFCYTDKKEEKALFFKNDNESINYLLFDMPLDQSILLLANLISIKKQKFNLIYKFIKFTNELTSNSRILSNIQKLFKWPTGNKGIEYLSIISYMEETLLEKLYENKLSLSTAVFYHKTFVADYSKLLQKLPEKTTFSELDIILNLVSEINLAYNWKLSEIIDKIKSENKTNKITAKQYIDFLNKLRYPNQSETINLFDKYISNFTGKPNDKKCVIEYDKSFERDKYTMKINFKTLTELESAIKSVLGRIENFNNSQGKDLFIRENLFNSEQTTSINNGD